MTRTYRHTREEMVGGQVRTIDSFSYKDEQGKMYTCRRMADPIDNMWNRGKLSAVQYGGGQKYREDFERAYTEALAQVNADKIIVDAKRHDWTPTDLDAWQRLIGLEAHLHGREGHVLRHCVGLGWPVLSWAEAHEVSEYHTREILIAALDKAARYYDI